MITISLFAIFLIVLTNFTGQECAVMEATIQIESDNIRMTSFLERFKNFIAQSHARQQTFWGAKDNGTTVETFVHHNDSLQANYDFTKNLLTIGSSYSLVLNGTDTKISDVKITINFKFSQDSNERIILEDLHDDSTPRIALQNDILERGMVSQRQSYEKLKTNEEANHVDEDIINPTWMLFAVVNIIEPIVITFLHIIINGILGHVLTTAFDHFYHGRLTLQ